MAFGESVPPPPLPAPSAFAWVLATASWGIPVSAFTGGGGQFPALFRSLFSPAVGLFKACGAALFGAQTSPPPVLVRPLPLQEPCTCYLLLLLHRDKMMCIRSCHPRWSRGAGGKTQALMRCPALSTACHFVFLSLSLVNGQSSSATSLPRLLFLAVWGGGGISFCLSFPPASLTTQSLGASPSTTFFLSAPVSLQTGV